VTVRRALACQQCNIRPGEVYDAGWDRVGCRMCSDRLCVDPLHTDGRHSPAPIPDEVAADPDRPVLNHYVETTCARCSATVYCLPEYAGKALCVECGFDRAGVDRSRWFVPDPAMSPVVDLSTPAASAPTASAVTHVGCTACVVMWEVSGYGAAIRAMAVHAHEQHGGPPPTPDNWISGVPGGRTEGSSRSRKRKT
jgi:hypothetical protein